MEVLEILLYTFSFFSFLIFSFTLIGAADRCNVKPPTTRPPMKLPTKPPPPPAPPPKKSIEMWSKEFDGEMKAWKEENAVKVHSQWNQQSLSYSVPINGKEIQVSVQELRNIRNAPRKKEKQRKNCDTPDNRNICQWCQSSIKEGACNKCGGPNVAR